ncbi:DEAD/DEAH box helicase [Halovulum sp. GXIMD14793]
MTTFKDLGLRDAVLKSLTAQGYDAPTPIQKQAIPLVLEGRDVMGLAQTGTGKTAAFGLPLVHNLLGGAQGKPLPKTVRSLILAPTRELANQIAETLNNFTRQTPLKVTVVVGGASIRNQIRKLDKGTDILVATPGRLLDLVDQRAVILETATFLVLDEADQMLDMGFIKPLKRIAGLIARKRQTMLFSATMPKAMEELSTAYLRDPAKIEVAPQGKAADKITQCVHFLEQPDKTTFLKELLSERPEDLSLVFARTKHGAEKLMKSLVASGLKAASIHGNKSQGQRDRAIRDFRDGKVRVLVATDVAARGIDIPGVSHVYNYDLPEVTANYVHRIGRTARAGAEGEAVAFCGAHEVLLLRDIERLMKISVPVASGEAPVPLKQKKPRRGRGGGQKVAQGQGKPAQATTSKPKRRRNRRRSGGGGQRQAA